MTTPPDFGGLEIEEGIEEDLGAKPSVHGPAESDELDPDEEEDNELHAPGATCARCGGEIEPGQDVRRRADGTWVHEFCPV
jgi:hypothetical protein